MKKRLSEVQAAIVGCRLCPRLVAWREKVAVEKRRAFRDQTYWGRPVPGFGDPSAKLLIVGLAPAAHGANRTGRMFTGDRSGDFLYAALHRKGFANQPTSTAADDGLKLSGAFIVAAARCAPPDNKPLPEELSNCQVHLDAELDCFRPKVFLALGAIAFEATLGYLARRGHATPSPKPRFGHGARVVLPGAPLLLASFHVSQQNTQTGRLTEAMFDRVLDEARAAL